LHVPDARPVAPPALERVGGDVSDAAPVEPDRGQGPHVAHALDQPLLARRALRLRALPRQGEPGALLLGRLRLGRHALLGPIGAQASRRHPNCADWVMAEAYSHEVSSAGFWPGGGAHPYPFSTATPTRSRMATRRLPSRPRRPSTAASSASSSCPTITCGSRPTPRARCSPSCKAATRPRPTWGSGPRGPGIRAAALNVSDTASGGRACHDPCHSHMLADHL